MYAIPKFTQSSLNTLIFLNDFIDVDFSLVVFQQYSIFVSQVTTPTTEVTGIYRESEEIVIPISKC